MHSTLMWCIVMHLHECATLRMLSEDSKMLQAGGPPGLNELKILGNVPAARAHIEVTHCDMVRQTQCLLDMDAQRSAEIFDGLSKTRVDGWHDMRFADCM